MLTKSRTRAFTLLETLVAMAILTFLVTLLAMIFGDTSQVVGDVRDRTAVESRARVACSMIRRDLSHAIFRVRDSAPSAAVPGNDVLSFYTEKSGYAGDRRLSVVSYEIVEGNLVRGSVGQKFGTPAEGAGNEILQIDPSVPLPAPADQDVQEVAPRVVRMEIGFLDPSDPDGPYVVNWPGSEKATALVVTLVLVEDEAIPFMDTGQIATLENYFPDATDGRPPLAQWQSLIYSSSESGGLPPVFLRSLRAYQRVFPLL